MLLLTESTFSLVESKYCDLKYKHLSNKWKKM